MAFSAGILVALLAVTISSMVDFTVGAPVPGIGITIPPTHINIRVVTEPRNLTGYGTGSGCLSLPNDEAFVVQGPSQLVSNFCIRLYKNIEDCKNAETRFDYVIHSSNMPEARNLPPVQGIRQCTIEESESEEQ